MDMQLQPSDPRTTYLDRHTQPEPERAAAPRGRARRSHLIWTTSTDPHWGIWLPRLATLVLYFPHHPHSSPQGQHHVRAGRRQGQRPRLVLDSPAQTPYRELKSVPSSETIERVYLSNRDGTLTPGVTREARYGSRSSLVHLVLSSKSLLKRAWRGGGAAGWWAEAGSLEGSERWEDGH